MKLLIFLSLFFVEPDSILILMPDTQFIYKRELGRLTVDTVITYKEEYIVDTTKQQIVDKLDLILKKLEEKRK